MSNKIQTLIKKIKKFGYHVFKPKTVDVVCNMKIEAGFISSEYKGRMYSFCSEHCKAQFDANPAQFTGKKSNAVLEKQSETKDEHKPGSCCH